MTFLAHEYIFDAAEMLTFLAHEHIFDATEMMTFLAHEHIFDATENWGGFKFSLLQHCTESLA